MQLMTFNSLLMFDIVFVFFLFLVGVTCLVYYLPTGGGGTSKHHSHIHHDPESAGESSTCRYERHRYYPCPHHRLSQLHQLRYNPHSVEVDTEGTETETESEVINFPEQQDREKIQVQSEDQDIREHLVTPIYPCRCSLSAGCAACAYASSRKTDCVIQFAEEGAETSDSTVDLRVLERHPTPHHRYCYRHSIQTNRCLHYVDDDDPDNDSSDDIFYCNDETASAAIEVNGLGGLLNSVASSISPLFQHDVVNETENGTGATFHHNLQNAPQCCYIKPKFMDVRECKGPIVDV